MNMEHDEVIPVFLVECRELLEQMEQGLLEIENGGGSADTVHALFRSAHTIKGSAGLFGFDDIVHFTHGVESVLDRVREGLLAIDLPLAELLLASADHIAALVKRVEERLSGSDPALTAQGHDLLGQLARFMTAPEQTAGAAGSALPVTSSATTSADSITEPSATDQWHLSLRFGLDVLRCGMDPIALARYLGTLGEITAMRVLDQQLPALDALDPEACYLGFELAFRSQASRQDIEGAFDFVRDDAHIQVLEPHSSLAAYAAMVGQQGSELAVHGRALVECGSLTAEEWEQVVALIKGTAAPVPDCAGQPAASVASQPQGSPTRFGNDAPRQKMLRVDAEKLDQLINLVGELVIASAGANIIAAELGVARMLESTSTMARLIEEVRDNTLNLRMVQIGETFNRFQRVVRDVAKELGKDIRLEISGADTELDKTMVEKIGDPLMHLVRNAMDHGIEATEVRLSRGKPAEGKIRLNAYHDSGGIVIEVGDDGGGLNRERILQKAVEKGLVGPQQHLADHEIYDLIFAPGFSTAEKLSNISGRGVGMDVVKKNIESLHGTIEIDSTPGMGSTMRIRLPLTLAIIDGFLVGVGNAAFVIPLDQVVECLELPRHHDSKDQRREYVNQRGQVLPYTQLREALELPPDGIPQEGPQNLVVVQYGGKRAGLAVDSLQGEIQTVIKPLGQIFSQVQGISGSTILGSGAVALILDIPRLMQQVTDRAAATPINS
ncbi:MAG TPA: chemotaxis protein CheA [Azospira sp.]|nr:chemotaxis protein CheA [Azospira sp.]